MVTWKHDLYTRRQQMKSEEAYKTQLHPQSSLWNDTTWVFFLNQAPCTRVQALYVSVSDEFGLATLPQPWGDVLGPSVFLLLGFLDFRIHQRSLCDQPQSCNFLGPRAPVLTFALAFFFFFLLQERYSKVLTILFGEVPKDLSTSILFPQGVWNPTIISPWAAHHLCPLPTYRLLKLLKQLGLAFRNSLLCGQVYF